jgi:rhodanese-related sulfurtransferase
MVDLPAAMTEMDPSTPTLLVCRSGSRSQRAAVFLAMSGFTSVANLAGGMKALGLQA